MPRYFFHVIDGVDVPDLEGTLLPGLAEARSQAIVTAGEILKSEGTAVLERHRVADEGDRRRRHLRPYAEVLGR